MPSSQSRGKGSRRMPGKDGGIRKKKSTFPNRWKQPDIVAPRPVQGLWYEIKPTALSKQDKDHSWVFARYSEYRREDGNYTVFLFRDEARSQFGIKEWLGEHIPHSDDLRKLAYQVITDNEFRKSLLSDDPDLPEMWKKH